jgi:hypothetical protein
MLGPKGIHFKFWYLTRLLAGLTFCNNAKQIPHPE